MRLLAARLLSAPLLLLLVAAVTYAIPRWVHPEMYGHAPLLGGVSHDLGRIFLHFDLGHACGWPGCPQIRVMWARGAPLDLWLLGGALVIGVTAGVRSGLWCAQRPGSPLARALEAFAMLAFCTPVYVVAAVLLLLFNPTFGRFPLPGLFDANPDWSAPWSDPWGWLRTLLVPWIVLAAPLAAMFLRLTLAMTREALDEDYTRTAVAKGLSPTLVVRRHAGRAAYPPAAALASVAMPLLVLNIVLVERTLSVPGFLSYTWRATGHPATVNDYPPLPDYPMIAALMLWGALLTIALSLLLEGAVARLDPRIAHE
jgi:peptide/nickel transport system permease protein